MILPKYEELKTLQNNVCAICKKEELGKDLAVDHCHKTQKVRGLLCENCNRAIGLFKDDPVVCRAASDYLELSRKLV